MLALDTGELLTENVAILDWIADQYPALRPAGSMGRTRLVEALAYISTEIHKGFHPFCSKADEGEKSRAGATITARLQYLATSMKAYFLFGDAATAADCHLRHHRNVWNLADASFHKDDGEKDPPEQRETIIEFDHRDLLRRTDLGGCAPGHGRTHGEDARRHRYRGLEQLRRREEYSRAPEDLSSYFYPSSALIGLCLIQSV